MIFSCQVDALSWLYDMTFCRSFGWWEILPEYCCGQSWEDSELIVSSGFDDGGKGGGAIPALDGETLLLLPCPGGDAHGSNICMVAGLWVGTGTGAWWACLIFGAVLAI